MVFRSIARKELSDGQLADLFNKGKTSVIKGFQGKAGKPFDAAVTFDPEFKTVFDFPKNKPSAKGMRNRRK